MTVTCLTTAGAVGPGYLVSFNTTVGPIPVDDMFYAQIAPTTGGGNFFCAGSRYTNAITSAGLVFGMHDSPVGGQGVLDAPRAPGLAVDITAWLLHADGVTVVDGPGVFTGFTWDPINGLYHLIVERATSQGMLAKILAAVYRPFPYN